MGKEQKKTGKGRLDKWYQLAKEQGYRARSAFKLVQLNRKYDFLANARCVIDLCAAPGGWLQVAAKQMPKQNTLIIGVDLVPIKPIPRCITLVEDITTESCRRALRQEMKDWKADVVLHDGAPNVGSAWVQDAFTQVELVLASLKLAVEFLEKGGTFCTKVFRSKDYNSLLWVFNQLFTKVEATKPPSSRNVSAEIFVTCQGFLKPDKIDPKLLNPKFVFSEVDGPTEDDKPANKTSSTNPLAKLEGKAVSSKDVMTPAALNVFAPEKKRKQREGYDDGDMTLYKECRVMEFIRSNDPIGVLGLVNRMRFLEDEDKKLLKNPLTTDDFEGAREEYEEDAEMEEEADIDAQEKAEIEKAERIAKLGLTTAEAMTLAQQLVNREATKTQLIDQGFNRHTDIVGGDGLPSWFLDDEQRHFRHNIPITKEAVQAIRDKQRELNARPIKKIAEAKARKKMRQIRRIEKVRAKAQGINDDEENGLTEKEKAASIAKILAKSAGSGPKTKKPEKKLVVATGANRALKGRPKGVKGKYKMVDPRLKKEVRALKRIQKRDRKNGGRKK